MTEAVGRSLLRSSASRPVSHEGRGQGIKTRGPALDTITVISPASPDDFIAIAFQLRLYRPIRRADSFFR